MSPLHGLRLNCLLAPLIAAVVGVAAVLVGWHLHATAMARAAERDQLTALTGLARLAEADVAPSLAAWQSAHAGWTGLAQVQVRDESVILLGQAGAVPLRGEASPQLMLAYQGGRIWFEGGAIAYAAPCLPRSGSASVLVGWREPEMPVPLWPWLALAGGVLLLGGGLGAYLVVRVYRPVEWLQQAAEAAAAGRSEPPGAPDSPETASLRSSIATLISQRRHSDGADGSHDA